MTKNKSRLTTSKNVQKLFEEMRKGKEQKKITLASIKSYGVCEHGKVDYKTLVKLNKRHYQMNWRLIDIIERLERTNTILTDANKEFSEAFVEMEKKFSNASETLEHTREALHKVKIENIALRRGIKRGTIQ